MGLVIFDLNILIFLLYDNLGRFIAQYTKVRIVA
jgi:hypothetical protein